MIARIRLWIARLRELEMRRHIADVERWQEQTAARLPELREELRLLESERRTLEARRLGRAVRSPARFKRGGLA